jgi:Flp pilus assembly CpaE family ATPase
VITERTKKISSETMIPTAKTQQAVSTLTGMSTVAFVSASGGVGRTTLAENIGYELGRTGAKTLLMSMDLPTPTPLHMHLRTTPDAAEYFSNPKEGLA